MKKKLLLIAAAAAVLAFLVVTLGVVRQPERNEFCEVCAARQVHSSWALRGTERTLVDLHHIKATPMSELLASKKLAGATHSHRWLAPRQVPDPLNEFGPPVWESLEFISSPRVVGFMRDAADFADPISLANWRANVLKPEFSYVLDDALRYLKVPEHGFGDSAQFLAWWGQNAYALQNRLREETEAD